MDINSGTMKIGLNISPNEADIAVVPIDSAGTPGMLNMLVLNEYGYSEKDLPKKDALSNGFSKISIENGRKSIIFVVTIKDNNTSENLEHNLYNTLVEFRNWFRERKLWIPLMGTGEGGLSLDESYIITDNVIRRFQEKYQTETNILISIPNSEKGKEFYKIHIEPNLTEKTTNEEAEVYFKSLGVKFYLVGAYWSGNDQTDRFTKEGIWEKGYEDESYSSLINSIKVNDILVIKSTFQSSGISYLKIKAVGVVTENQQNGSILKVDWKITGLWEDIENLGFFRNTVQEASLEHAILILSRLERNRWNDLRQPAPQIKETIAGLVSDSDYGIDYLEISKDVNAFARVISTKSFEPPLAIALFGKWGSGKSFFMRKLKEQVVNLSAKKKWNLLRRNCSHSFQCMVLYGL